MIHEQVRKDLEELFPEDEPLKKDKSTPESPEEISEDNIPRPNGVLSTDYTVCGYHLDAQVAPEQLLDAINIIDSHQFFIESITGVDWIEENQLEVVYDFSRYDFDLCRVVVRTRMDRDNGVIPSITAIYAGANWHERETAEFFGIKFTNHPNLIPLLLPEDADFHPLRKDFKA